MEKRMDSKNEYFTIYQWMITDLCLSGSKLMLYALIYGFTIHEGRFSGRISYMEYRTGVSRRQVIDAISYLMDAGLVRREETRFCGKKQYDYIAVTCAENAPVTGAETAQNSAETAPDEVRKLHNTGAETAPLSPHTPLSYNNNYILNTIRACENARARDTEADVPDLSEVEAYCRERGNSVNPKRFYDYHAAIGWIRNGYPIQDWRAIVRLWESNGIDDRRVESSGPGEENGSFDADVFFEAALKRSYE